MASGGTFAVAVAKPRRRGALARTLRVCPPHDPDRTLRSLLAQVGARGLVWFGVAQIGWTLPLVALLSFAAVYGRLAGWNVRAADLSLVLRVSYSASDSWKSAFLWENDELSPLPTDVA